MDALKLVLVLLAILAALRRRVSVGVTLVGAGVLTALLYQVPFAVLWDGYVDLATSEEFISLTALVVAITVLGNLLKELGYLTRLANACEGLYGGSRTAVALMPGLVGLMPMPGGSLLSAPLIDSVLDKPRYSPHFKCAVNYWFRHLTEFSWPVYAGLILTAAITGMPISDVALLQLPLSVLMFLIGLVVFITRIADGSDSNHALWRPLGGIAASVWPVVAAIAAYGLLDIPLVFAVVGSLVLVVLIGWPNGRQLFSSLKEGFSPKLILLVFGVLSFQKVVELSGGVEAVTQLATEYQLPDELIVFIVMFAIGLLTGMVSAYVGLGYALLAGLLYQPELRPGLMMLAYLSGFIGVILAPTHLCLILTNNYFGSDLTRVYRLLLIPLALLGLGGYLLYRLGWGDLFL